MKYFKGFLKRAFAFVLALAMITANLETDIYAADFSGASLASLEDDSLTSEANSNENPNEDSEGNTEETPSENQENNNEGQTEDEQGPEEGLDEENLEEEEDLEELEELEEDLELMDDVNLVLYLEDENGHRYNAKYENGETNAVFDYNLALTFSLENLPSGVMPEYSFDDTVYDNGNNTVSAGASVGMHDVGYYATFNDHDYMSSDGDYKVRIRKAPLANVPSEDIGWTNGSVANWKSVKNDRNENIFSGNCNYELNLYRDGILVTTEPVNVSGSASDSNVFDFKNLMTQAGEYTFSVRAVPSSSLATNYDKSVDSIMSTSASSYTTTSAKTYAVEITLVSGFGIETVTPSENRVLIAGGSSETEDFNKLSISAELMSGWSDFGSWTSDVSTGVTIKDSKSQSTAVVLNQTCTATAVTLTATATESVSPTINDFAIDADNKERFKGAAQDDESGLASYALTTNSSAPADGSADWIAWPEGLASVTIAPNASGDYYFHIKDNCGNTATSDSSIHATRIEYRDYYVLGTEVTSEVHFRLGDGEAEDFMLPVCQNGDKPGNRFIGWFDNSSYTPPAITKVTTSTGTDTFVAYAKWEEDQIKFKTPLPETITEDYKGANIPLTVEMDDFLGEITFDWYKWSDGAYAAIEGAHSATLNLRNVTDSGKYKVVASGTSSVVEGHQENYCETTVTINPAALTVTADDKEIHYGDEAPLYTVSYSGLVGSDVSSVSDPSSVFSQIGTVSSTYVSGATALETGNTWPITISTEESTKYKSDNYTITQVDGTLTVNPRTASNANTTITLTNGYEYTYTGHAIKPVSDANGDFDASLITVTVDGVTVDSKYFTVSYENNEDARTAEDTNPPMVVVTFNPSDGQSGMNNYSGSATVAFTILRKAVTLEVAMADWEYDGQPKTPSLISDKVGTSDVVYMYTNGDAQVLTLENKSSWSSCSFSDCPVNAGTYMVYAYQEADAHGYAEAISAPSEFTISKRVLTFTAGSSSWEYDGSAHSDATYTQDGELALEGESIQNVVVTGTITDYGTKENTIKVTLSSATNASNYQIVEVPGILEITPQKLPAPGNIGWVSSSPGKVSWIAIFRQNLTVQYEVKLYETIDGVTTCVDTQTVTGTSYDFKNTISGRIGAGSAKSYSVTVTTKVLTDAKNNYSDSDPSDRTSDLYTATIYAKVTDNVGSVTISATGIDPQTATVKDDTVGLTLIQGQSATITAVPVHGYKFGQWQTLNTDLAGFVSFGNYQAASTSVTLTSAMTSSQSELTVIPSVGNEDPNLTGFTVSNDDAAGNRHVDLSVTFADTLGLTEWYLFRSALQDDGAHSKGEYQVVKTYTINPSEVTGDDVKSYSKSIEITNDGEYYVGVKDDTDKVTVYTDRSFIVYQVVFAQGDTTETQANPIPTIYKLENTTINLPNCTFTKQGYVIKNWSGARTGISANEGQYAANKSDTLTALWTNEQITYTVQYYYMKSDGTYSEVPDTTAAFMDVYDAEITNTDSKIQKAKTNYVIDNAYYTAHSIPSSIQLNAPGQVLKLYYRVQQYKITYSYTDPVTGSKVYYNKTNPETGEEIPNSYYDEYHYGATVTIRTTPTRDGYDFVGWVFEAGSAPSTMPAQNIEATGTFIAKDAKYTVVYYERNLNPDDLAEPGYTLNSDLTDELNAHHNTLLNFTEEDAKEIEGFTLEAVAVSENGIPTGTAQIPADAEYVDADGKVTASGTVSLLEGHELVINCYYSRNKYDLALRIYRDNREEESNKLFDEKKAVEYDAPIDTDAFIASYKTQTEVLVPTGYAYASYIDYSTGTKPVTMPAGNVVITRDLILADKATYKVQIYFESGTVGTYEMMTEISYEDLIGTSVKIVAGSEKTYDTTTNTISIGRDLFAEVVHNYTYYTFSDDEGYNTESDLEGVIHATRDPDTMETIDPLVLKVYYERKETVATVRYYYGNQHGAGGNKLLASFQLKGKWGTSYTFNPKALFDRTTESDFVNAVNLAGNKANDSVERSIVASDITWGTSNASKTYSLNKDFRNGETDQYDSTGDPYLVSYANYYTTFNSAGVMQGNWPTAQLTSVDALNRTYTCTFGCSLEANNATCNIYYNQIETNDDLYVDVRYDLTNSLTNTSEVSADIHVSGPITHNWDGVDYPVRIMNKCAIVKPDSKGSTGSDSESTYPAASAQNRTIVYSGDRDTQELFEGFTYIGTSGGQYYYFYEGHGNDALGSDKYVVISNENSTFMIGRYCGYSLGSNTDEYKKAKTYLDYYKENATGDVRRNAGYVYNQSYGSTYMYGNGVLTYTYRYSATYKIIYNFRESACTGHDEMVSGTLVKKEDIHCEHIADENKPGYKVVWYKDAYFKNPVTDFTIVGTTYVFGRYEKKELMNKEYAFYELPDSIEIDGNDYNYITEEIINTLISTGTLTSDAPGTEYTYALDGKSVTCHKIKYYYDGELVIVESEQPSYSYSEIRLATPYDDESYRRVGFSYDVTNTNNRNNGYVQDTPLSLKLYYSRDRYQVIVDPNITAKNNLPMLTYHVGQIVNLSSPVDYVPTRDGYEFDEWKWSKEKTAATATEPATFEDWDVADSEWGDADHKTVKMPGINIKATAQWKPAEFEQDIYHYFQKKDRSYDTEFIDGISGACATTTVSYNGAVYSAKLYGSSPNYSAAVITIGSGDSAIDYYFSKVTNNGVGLVLDEVDLVAAKQITTFESEAEVAVNTYKLSGFGMYDFDLVNYKDESTVTPVSEDTFIAKYGMKVGYYYSRSADNTIRLIAKATDGQVADEEHGITLIGDGEYYYGQTAPLSANLGAGFSMVGWYAASDVLANCPAAPDPEVPLSTYSLKDDWESATAKSSAATYNAIVNKAADYVAVVMARNPVDATLTLGGQTTYEYGYTPDKNNSLSALVTLNDGDEKDKTGVSEYKWFLVTQEDGVEVEREVPYGRSSTYLFPAGKHAGTYTYRCKVTLRHADSGRTETLSDDITVTVSKTQLSRVVKTEKYEGTFDLSEHSIKSFSVDVINSEVDRYEVYMSEDTPLDSTNYNDATVSKKVTSAADYPKYKHVNSADGKACAHTTYYYVHDLDGNYEDCYGSELVNIKPKTVTVSAGNQIFEKTYDASAEVNGSIIEEGTDLYNLSRGRGTYYILDGILENDDNSEAYVLACNATYNSMHAVLAKTFTVRDMYIVNRNDLTGETVYDYAFPDEATFVFTGNINARELTITWTAPYSFEYNGKEQSPMPELQNRDTDVPAADRAYITIDTTGKQINVGGGYVAYVTAKQVTGAHYYPSDYVFGGTGQEYEITKRNIKVKATAADVVYDGEEHTLTNYSVVHCNESGIEDGEPGLVSEQVSGQTHTSTATQGNMYSDYGTYDDIKFSNLIIKNASKAIMNDNYNIVEYTCGTLTLNRSRIYVDGITAEDKDYDGNTGAVLKLGDIEFHALNTDPTHPNYLVETDELNLDPEKVHGAFADASVGEDKTVNISIDSDALTGAGAGNYELITVSPTQQTTTADINAKGVKIKANPLTVTYAQTANFTYAYSELPAGESATEKLTGTPTYDIQTGTDSSTGEPVWSEYVPGTIGVGTYKIRVNNAESLSMNNYAVTWDSEDETAILTVKSRPIKVVPVASADITKSYDGTTDVLHTDSEIILDTHYQYSAVENVTESGIFVKDGVSDTVNLSWTDKAYNYKNISTATTNPASKVTLSGLEIDNDNYELVNTSVDIKGTITQIILTIAAKATSVEYGAAPTLTATFSGFADGDGTAAGPNSGVLSGTLSVRTSTFDRTVAANRNVGTYENDIFCTGFGDEGSVNGNYTIHYLPATLTVTPVTVYVTADCADDSNPNGGAKCHYKVGNVVDSVTGQTPKLIYHAPTLKYTEDTALTDYSGITLYCTEDGYIDGTAVGRLSLPNANGYPIKFYVNTDGTIQGITYSGGAQNYIFKPKEGKMIVEKYTIAVSGITIPDKVYDGTTAVVGEPGLSGIIFTGNNGGLDPTDADYISTHADEYGIKSDHLKNSSTYNNKNVGSREVTLSIALSDYLAARYELDTNNTQKKATSNITARPITIKAKDKSIVYGTTKPNNYGVEEVKPLDTDPDKDKKGLVSGEALSSTYFTLPSANDYDCLYSSTSGSYSYAGEYDVTPKNMTAANGNYSISYAAGKLTVTKATLSAPSSVTWDGSNPGTIKWSSVTGIGDVAVGGYSLTLFKDNTEVGGAGMVSVGGSVTSYDFADAINASGAGAYTVKVKALASETKNESKCNVNDSANKESGKLYAAIVKAVFASDTDTAAAHTLYNDPTVGGVSEKLVIGGQTNIPILASVISSSGQTGYTLKSVTSSSSQISIASPALATETVSGKVYGKNISANISNSSSLASSATITVTITMQARQATLTAEMSLINKEASGDFPIPYGYSDAGAPKFKVEYGVSSDNVSTDEYDYTFEFYRSENKQSNVKETFGNEYAVADGANAVRFTHPTGLRAHERYYYARCKVTAARKDNGKSISVYTNYVSFDIIRASFSANVTMEGWTYGETRKAPGLTRSHEELTENYIHYKYSTSQNGTYMDEIYTDAGTYYVKAIIDETSNYGGCTTDPIAFTISPNKLATPTALHIEASGKTSGGTAKWNAVLGPKENNGAADSESSISVKYTVKVYESNGAAKTLINTISDISGTQVDISEYINTPNKKFVFTVQAMSSKTSNCLDSDESEYSSEIDVAGSVEAYWHEQLLTNANSYEEVYDGTPIRLHVIFESIPGEKTYQWYKNGVAISGMTGTDISLTYVEQNAIYSCAIIVDGTVYYSPFRTITITPRPVTIVTEGDTWTYDAKNHTRNVSVVDADHSTLDWKVSDSTPLPTGDSATLDFKTTSIITNVGSVDNDFEHLTITKDLGSGESKVVFTESGSNNNYTLTKSLGKLIVTKRAIDATGISITFDEAPDFEYDGYEHKPAVTVKDSVSGSEVVLTAGSTGEYTLTWNNNIYATTDSSKAHAVITSNEKNYTGTYTLDFDIAKRPISFKSASHTWVYDSAAHKDNAYTILSEGTSKGLVNISDSNKDVETVTFTSDSTITNYTVGGVQNKFNTIVIKHGTKDVTSSYDITQDLGTLMITKATSVTKNVSDLTKYYDGTAVSDPTYNKTGDGVVTIKYYKKNGDNWELLSGAPKLAGDYKAVVVIAEGANYQKYDESTTGFSGYKEFTIKKRPIKVTANSTQWPEYTTNTLVDSGFTTTSRANLTPVLASGEEISATVTGSRTNAGSSDNVITDAVVKITSTGEVTTDNYDIEYVNGTLTIGKATPNLTVEGKTTTYDGKTHPVTYSLNDWGDGEITVTYVKQATSTSAAVTLAAGEMPVDVGTYNVTVKSAETTNFVEKTITTAKIVINSRKITLLAPSASKMYDGTALTARTIPTVTNTATDEGLAEDESITSVTYTDASTITDYKSTTTANVISSVVIKHGEKDVTSNYTITKQAGTLSITKRPITIAANSRSGVSAYVYDSTEKSLAAAEYTISATEGNGLASTDNISALTLQGKGTDVGTYTTSVKSGTVVIKRGSTVTTGNYEITLKSGEIKILPRTLKIKAGSKNVTYTGSKVTLSFADGDYEITEGSIQANDKLTALTLTGEGTNVGEYTTNASGAVIKRNGSSTDISAKNYTILYETGSIVINRATQVITASNIDTVYDGAMHTVIATAKENPTITYEIINEDDAGSDAPNSRTKAGIQTIRITAEQNQNYDSITKEVYIKISKRPITVTAKSDSKIYDNSPLTNSGWDITSESLATGGSSTHVLTADISGTITDVGEETNTVGDVVIKEGDTDVTSNYEITKVNGKLTVTQHDQEITVNPLTFTYDAQNHQVAAGTGLGYVHVLGDGAISVVYKKVEGGTETELPSGTYPKRAGTYKAYITAAETLNYKARTVSTTITINKRDLEITADSLGVSTPAYYDGSSQSANTWQITSGALQGSDNVDNVSFATTSTRTVVGQTDNVIVSVVIKDGSEDVTASYNITTPNGVIKITARPITIIANSHTGDGAYTYNNTERSLSANEYTISTERGLGLADTDKVQSLTLSGSRIDAGTVTTTASNLVVYTKTTNENVTGNYNITYVDGAIEIKQKELKIRAGSKNEVYCGNVVSLAFVPTDYDFDGTALAAGDVLTGLTLSGNGRDVGIYTTTPSAAEIKHNGTGENIASNYDITYETGSITITKRPLKIRAISKEITYNGKYNTLSFDDNEYSFYGGTSLGAGDALTDLTLTGGGTSVGDYEVTSSAAVIKLNGAGEDLAAKNYDITYDSGADKGSLKIKKRPLQITADSAQKAGYDGQPVTANSYQITGGTSLAEDESIYAFTVTGSQTEKGESDNVPSDFKIKHGSDDSNDVTSNYEIEYVNGRLSVGLADQQITTTPLTYEYNAEPREVSDGVGYHRTVGVGDISVVYYLVGDHGNTPLATGTYPTRVGVYKAVITAAASDNYKTLTVETTITITKRPITVKAGSIGTDSANPLYYDGLPHTQPLDYSVVSTKQLAIGDAISNVTFTSTSTGTNVGSTDNVIDTITIMDGSDDVTYCYDISKEKGEIKITKRPVTIVAGSHAGAYADVYDNTAKSLASTEFTTPVISGTSMGLASTDEVRSLTLSGGGTDAGTYTTTASNAVIYKSGTTTDVSQNYVISYQTGTIEIKKKTLKIKPVYTEKTYNGTTVSLDFAAGEYEYYDGTSLAAGDVLTGLTLSGSGKNAGEYDTNASAAIIKHNGTGANIANNYDITYGTDKIKINKATQVISALDINVTYDALPHTIIATALENPTISYSIESGSGDGSEANSRTDAGSHVVKVSAAENTNYNATTATYTITINKRPITLKAADHTRPYDGNPISKNEYSLTVGSLVNTGSIKHEFTTLAVAPASEMSDVGTVANKIGNVVITETNSSTGATKDVTANYAITKVDGTLEITKETPTIVAEDLTVEYDGTCHTITAKAYVAGVEVPVTLTYSSGVIGQTVPGTQTVKIEVAETFDYVYAWTEVTLTVTKRKLTLTAASDKKYYDGLELTAPTFTISSGSIVTGQALDENSVIVTGSQLKVGTSQNTIEPDSVHIYNTENPADFIAANEVTDCYEIKFVDGKLIVRKRDEENNTPVEPSKPNTPQTPVPTPTPTLPIIIIPTPVPTRPIIPDTGSEETDDEDTTLPSISDNDSGEEKEEGKEDGYKKGSIIVYVETPETDAGKIEADVPDKQKVLDEVMNDEIAMAIENDDIEVRVTVDPIEDLKVPDKDAKAIKRLVEELKEDKPGMKFGRYVDLKLDWRINHGEWNNVPETDNPIDVTIEIPKDLLKEGRTYYIVVSKDGRETILKDNDNVFNTITVSTRLFDSTYAILYDEDVEAVRCYWHIIILIMMLLSAGFALFCWKKDDDDDEDVARVRRKFHIPLIIIFNGVSVICLFLGHCRYDLPCEILCLVVSAVTEGISAYRYRDRVDDKNQGELK